MSSCSRYRRGHREARPEPDGAPTEGPEAAQPRAQGDHQDAQDKLVSQDAANSLETRQVILQVKQLDNEVRVALQQNQITTNQKIEDLEAENKTLSAQLRELTSPRNQNSVTALERRLFESEANMDLLRRQLEQSNQVQQRLQAEWQDMQWKYLMIKSKLEASRQTDSAYARRPSSGGRGASTPARKPSLGNAEPLMNDLQNDLTRDVREYQAKTNEFCQQALNAVRQEIGRLRPAQDTGDDPRS